MCVRHGEGPWHDHDGPHQRPNVERPGWRSGSCACSFSLIRKITLVPCGFDGMPLYTAGYGCFRFSLHGSRIHERSYTDCVASGQAVKVKQPATQPPGGSESGERSEPVFARSVGPDRATNDRDEGGPTGTTELFCCSCSGAVRYRSLHYAATMVSSGESRCFRASTRKWGVSA